MRLLERLIAIVTPYDCLGCGGEGYLLCQDCRVGLEPVPDRCYRCHAASTDSRTCASCYRATGLRHVWIATDYDGAARELVKRLKFGRAAAASKPIALSISEVLPYIPSGTILVPIPTASNHVRQRGYDQVRLITHHLRLLTGYDLSPVLVRLGHSRQVGAGRKQRLAQLEGAFRAAERHVDYIAGKNILLVDDIVTTGATLESAARTLRAHGARSISAVVFAQKQ